MNIIERKITAVVDRHTVDAWDKALMLTSADTDSGEIIDQFSFVLGHSGIGLLEVDIKLVNGSDDCGPYVDAILFEDGCEMFCLEPGFESLCGTYSFETELFGIVTVEIVCEAS